MTWNCLPFGSWGSLPGPLLFFWTQRIHLMFTDTRGWEWGGQRHTWTSVPGITEFWSEEELRNSYPSNYSHVLIFEYVSCVRPIRSILCHREPLSSRYHLYFIEEKLNSWPGFGAMAAGTKSGHLGAKSTSSLSASHSVSTHTMLLHSEHLDSLLVPAGEATESTRVKPHHIKQHAVNQSVLPWRSNRALTCFTASS